MLSPRHHDSSELPPGHPCRGCPVRDAAGDHPPMERELYVAAGRELANAKRQMVLLGRKTAV